LKGDRGLLLLREAHIRGYLNLAQADTFDRHFWIRVGWTLEWLEQEHFREVLRDKYALHLALLNYELDQERFDLHWDQARAVQRELRLLLLPWLDNQELDIGKARKLEQLWIDIWGNPDDPEVAKRIQATANALGQQNLAKRVDYARN
jgi:hypothetical protein